MIATFAALYGRRLFIQWVASPTADEAPHEERYDRLVEFASIVRQLTDGDTVSFEGRYYAARSLKLWQPVDSAIRPEFVVSGSSPPGRGVSQTLRARSRYVQRGFGTFILNEPDSETDLENARVVFDDARRNVMEAA
jgi:alkanesulfonate monooxygenase